MTTRALFFLSVAIGLPVHAADNATALSARGDALGSGLAALWRESQPESPAAANALAASRLSLVAQSNLLFLPAGSMRNGGLGVATAVRLARQATELGAGPGFAGQFSTARAAPTELAETQPNWWSSSATFERGAWRAFAAHERAQDWLAPGASDEGWRLGAAYRFGNAQLSAGWERLRHEVEAGDARQQAWWIGFAQRVGDGALRLNFARATDVSGNLAAAPGGARQLSLGYEHGLSPQTAIYAFYTRLSNDPNGLFRLGGGEVDNALSAISRNGLSLGVRHAF
jgi:predicted porin